MSESSSSTANREVYRPQEHIFREGDEAFDFFIIESGEVEIYTQDKDGKKINIAKFNTGDSFGEFALLDKSKRSASAIALSETIVLRISEEGYEKLLEELPDWASGMLKSFAHRIKAMNERLKDFPQFISKD